MVKPVRTWIVVADAARARIVVNEGVGHGITDVAESGFANEILRDSEVYADRPGRVHERMGTGTRHSMARTTDVKDQSATAFARRIGEHLATQQQAKAYDRLVLIAEPSFLGHLRAALPKSVAGLVYAEIAKDLTRQKNDGLAHHLETVLAV